MGRSVGSSASAVGWDRILASWCPRRFFDELVNQPILVAHPKHFGGTDNGLSDALGYEGLEPVGRSEQLRNAGSEWFEGSEMLFTQRDENAYIKPLSSDEPAYFRAQGFEPSCVGSKKFLELIQDQDKRAVIRTDDQMRQMRKAGRTLVCIRDFRVPSLPRAILFLALPSDSHRAIRRNRRRAHPAFRSAR